MASSAEQHWSYRFPTDHLPFVDKAIDVGVAPVKQQIYLDKTDLRRDISAATNAKDAHAIVNINVYGSASTQADLGRDFSKSKVWLQRPDWFRATTSYDNPHTIRFSPEDDSGHLDFLGQDQESTTRLSFQDSVEQIYSMLTRDSQLKGLTGDARLRTSLLTHQEKALDFMIQREIGPIPEAFQLWEDVSQESEGGTWYRHKVTKIKSRTLPAETGGGILADEMGMGKTFCVLALIVRTLEQALAWSIDSSTHLAEGISPTKMLSRATLVVVPSPLLLTTWNDEIRARLDLPLKILVHHGNERPCDAKIMADHDIVLTTYHTLIADYKRPRPTATEVAWYRIVLDEAHFIRRGTAFFHKRVSELDTKFRWCLTGTPIQNSLDDLGSLFAFVGVPPFNRPGVFRKFISVPFNEGGSRQADGQSNLVRILDAMCIRRTQERINLPTATEEIRSLELTANETAQYSKMKGDMKRALQTSAGEVESRSKFSMFQAQLQLRLLCNHGTFQQQFHWVRGANSGDARDDMFASIDIGGEVLCSVCTQMVPTILSNRISVPSPTCAHVLCSECSTGGSDECPLCEAASTPVRRPVGGYFRTTSSAIYFRSSGYSTKMDALTQDLLKSPMENKSIVFTCWTTTLDLISQHLEHNNIPFMRIDGEHTIKHRQRVLQDFETKSEIRVLIMTTGVGAFGLSIIAANQVFLVEPQWNPSVEAQAIGRTMRIGQQKAVRVIRYVVKGTVEDIQNLQRRKRGIAEMTNHGADKTDDAHVEPA